MVQKKREKITPAIGFEHGSIAVVADDITIWPWQPTVISE